MTTEVEQQLRTLIRRQGAKNLHDALLAASREMQTQRLALFAILQATVTVCPIPAGPLPRRLAGEELSMAKRESFFSNSFGLIKQTFSEWLEDKAPQLGAALAYYTVFSLAPLVLVSEYDSKEAATKHGRWPVLVGRPLRLPPQHASFGRQIIFLVSAFRPHFAFLILTFRLSRSRRSSFYFLTLIIAIGGVQRFWEIRNIERKEIE